MSLAAAPIETDALVIGAGPAGLFQVFQLGLLGIHAQVVDALPHVGGQCMELYPDKPIYDIPGLPMCSGRELVQRLSQQIRPFEAGFHLGQRVASVRKREQDGRFELLTSAGQQFLARTVFIAAGVGAFLPRPLKIDGIEAHLERQVFHDVGERARFAGQNVVITGGGEAALQAALGLLDEPAPASAPRSIVLLHRRDVFQAEAETLARFTAQREQGRVRFLAGQITGLEQHGDRLAGLQWADVEGHQHLLPLDALIACLGLSPRLGPIADWGLAMERRQLVVDPASFETSEPGIFAIGDVNSYAGKKKLILCGFHEATLAAFAAAARIDSEARGPLQYTTTSSVLQQRLGVLPAAQDAEQHAQL